MACSHAKVIVHDGDVREHNWPDDELGCVCGPASRCPTCEPTFFAATFTIATRADVDDARDALN